MTLLRTRARQVALQTLYQQDLRPRRDARLRQKFVEGRLSDEGARAFCLALVDGVLEHKADIDRRISQAADNWRVERMATVDRNVLRIGTYELLYTREIPAGTVFDEAIEMARRFGGPESPGFVNGVLDQVRKNVDALRAEMGLPPRGDKPVETGTAPAETAVAEPAGEKPDAS
jgi:N utilization substance protein B